MNSEIGKQTLSVLRVWLNADDSFVSKEISLFEASKEIGIPCPSENKTHSFIDFLQTGSESIMMDKGASLQFTLLINGKPASFDLFVKQ